MEFEKEFVHFIWDDKLANRRVFIGDNIERLVKALDQDHERIYVRDSGDLMFPFKSVNHPYESYRFVYYDPLYDIKKAHEDGRAIEIRDLISGQWYTSSKPVFLPDRAGDYRIKDDSDKVTNRELAMWLALGNGEYKFVNEASNLVHHSYSYREDNSDKALSDDVRIRKWDSLDWHLPTKSYMRIWEEKDEQEVV